MVAGRGTAAVPLPVAATKTGTKRQLAAALVCSGPGPGAWGLGLGASQPVSILRTATTVIITGQIRFKQLQKKEGKNAQLKSYSCKCT